MEASRFRIKPGPISQTPRYDALVVCFDAVEALVDRRPLWQSEPGLAIGLLLTPAILELLASSRCLPVSASKESENCFSVRVGE
jgi:hypothetical protein